MSPAETVADVTNEPVMRLRKFALRLYWVLFLLMLLLAAICVTMGEIEILIIAVPIILIMALSLFTDRDVVHIPPTLIMLMVGTFYLMILARVFSDIAILNIAASILAGVDYGLLSLITVYILLRSMPSVKTENSKLLSFTVLAMSLAIFVATKMLQYFLSLVFVNIESVDLDDLMVSSALVVLGGLIVCAVYHLDTKQNLFRYTLTMFLEVNSEYLGIENREKEDILKLIRMGESERLEFKSTLRTNLQTGETDKRMEKAVLKSIVAFLNTDGGDLLVGVTDQDGICGVDVESFENKDKMGLHLTNLISSQIGNGFLSYISFGMTDFDDKTVIRVKCLSCPQPVFLKEGKTEIYYVRSGPSTVELTGMNLLNYVNSRRMEMVKKGRVFD